MNQIILATSNSGKIAELQPLLAPLKCITQSTLGIQSIEETGLSFIENALLKARHASEISKLPALADDSGLVVPILDGQPGIYSARYAGPNATDKNNIECLLSNLISYSGENRRAYFYCAIAMVKNATDPTPLIAIGQCSGEILYSPRGHHGFGYDPIFYVPEYQKTFAELSKEIKNTISHRAQALKQLTQQFQTQLIDYILKTSVS